MLFRFGRFRAACFRKDSRACVIYRTAACAVFCREANEIATSFHKSDRSCTDRISTDRSYRSSIHLTSVVRCCAGSVEHGSQPRKTIIDHAGYTTLTRQHELDHTDHTDQEYIFPERS